MGQEIPNPIPSFQKRTQTSDLPPSSKIFAQQYDCRFENAIHGSLCFEWSQRNVRIVLQVTTSSSGPLFFTLFLPSPRGPPWCRSAPHSPRGYRLQVHSSFGTSIADNVSGLWHCQRHSSKLPLNISFKRFRATGSSRT